MNKVINSEQMQKILDHLSNNQYEFALKEIQNLSLKFPDNLTLNKLFASTYFKK